MNESAATPLTCLPVEAFDWIRTSSLSELVANFARVHILVSLFDGDHGKWREFILRDGTDEERQHDLPFVERISERMAGDPLLLDHLRRLVREFSTIFA